MAAMVKKDGKRGVVHPRLGAGGGGRKVVKVKGKGKGVTARARPVAKPKPVIAASTAPSARAAAAKIEAPAKPKRARRVRSGIPASAMAAGTAAGTMRLLTRSFYDNQKLRIETSNRIAAQMKQEVLSEEWQQHLQAHLKRLEESEAAALADIKYLGASVDIWDWLIGIKGIGPAMAGVIISEIQDPARFDTVSKLWAFSGLHVKIDEATGIGRAPRLQRGVKANWSTFFRTKLVGVLGPSFLKTGSPYRDYYDNYKNRIMNRPCALTKEQHREAKSEVAEYLPEIHCFKGHVHNKAMRYMAKMLLMDLWKEWRTRRGLPVREPYAAEYLGKEHHA